MGSSTEAGCGGRGVAFRGVLWGRWHTSEDEKDWGRRNRTRSRKKSVSGYSRVWTTAASKTKTGPQPCGWSTAASWEQAGQSIWIQSNQGQAVRFPSFQDHWLVSFFKTTGFCTPVRLLVFVTLSWSAGGRRGPSSDRFFETSWCEWGHKILSLGESKKHWSQHASYLT